ncbi:MAG TPA: DUF1549 and DUF1553 domain-containing protein, partial [Polyangiaceae bacterium]|nr:DUF1549 and DUF1553 domain-containing protein [Polyangiaceae bacterium]
PAKPADDATWLRRVHFDVVGAPPTPEAVLAFLADRSADKRARKVEELLASPAYVAHWTNYWEDVLLGHEARDQRLDRAAFRAWLHARVAANAPWDAVVSELVSATGQNGDGGPRGLMAMDAPTSDAPMAAGAMGAESGGDGAGDAVNGAVNYTLRFAAPQDLAGAASRTFLGVQIQCAQCHDHKTEKWKQDDFRRFTATFLHAEVQQVDKGPVKGAVRRVTVRDVARVPPRFAKNAELVPIAAATPTALDGTAVDRGKDSRKALAAWMTSPQNPWFAKAYVNRMWAHFLGRGFANPVDDFRDSNPATHPELLARIAKDFAARKFDPKALIRLVCATEVYGLASSGGENLGAGNVLWGRFRLAPLGPEELLNHLFAATRLEQAAEVAGLRNLPVIKAQLSRSYTFLFDVDEESDAQRFEGNVAQALSLLNGHVTGFGTRALPGTGLSEVLAAPGDDGAKVDALYLRTLSRPPTAAERERALAFVRDAATRPVATPSAAPADAAEPPRGKRGKAGKGGKAGNKGGKKGGKGGANVDLPQLQRLAARAGSTDPRTRGFEDLFWALLNSSESLFNH